MTATNLKYNFIYQNFDSIQLLAMIIFFSVILNLSNIQPLNLKTYETYLKK
jgi:hypothetical protein